MTLTSGTRLGPYDILTPIGAGGMGEVYKARDPRLDRFVAIKVLPEHLASNADALARFEREAKAVAALNHPNILGIHDVAAHEGTRYVVMELLEGESLRARLDAGPIPYRKAMELAIQMAQGLAAAHSKGVVHRDLKPDNLWITQDGRLKILDFGLAKRMSGPSSMSESASTIGPTADTQHGTVLGTLGYMSPEQLRGEPVDARTDLFSFGAVLFEMMTGRPAFVRQTAADTMSAILNDDPLPSSSIHPRIPTAVGRIIGHCFEKAPALRFEGAHDVAFALESALDVPEQAGSAPNARPNTRRPSWMWWAAGLGVMALACGLVWYVRPNAEPAPSVAIRLVTYSGHDFSPAVSPDGKTLAFTSDRDGQPRIWLKQLKGGGEMALTSGPDDFPRFSPDGTSILFIHSQDGVTSLHRVNLLGNDPHKVVDHAEQGDWSPDGKQIAFVRLGGEPNALKSTLFMIDAAGGSERPLARFDADLVGFPRWSPDGKHIILNTPPIISSGTFRKLFLVQVPDGAIQELRPDNTGMLSCAAWASADDIVFLQAESVTGGGTAASSARAFVENIKTRRQRSLFWVGSSGTTLDLLPDRRVVFDAMSGRQNLREYALDGRTPPRWLTHGTIADRQPIVSPDGEWVVFSSNRSGNLDLWSVSTRTGSVRSLTDDPADDWDPAFSPDGGTLLWSSNRSGHLEVWASNPDGSGARQVTHDGEDAQNPTQTRDGRWIVYSSANRRHPGLWKIHPDGSQAQLVVAGEVQLPEVSPDGLYATYLITVRSHAVLHVARLEDGVDTILSVLPDPKRKTSVFPGRSRWIRDGSRVVFTGQNTQGLDGVFVQDFVFGKDTSSTRREFAGFDPDWITESLGLSRDGSRLILSESERIFSLMIAEGIGERAPRYTQRTVRGVLPDAR
ncbi:MAG: protein kinase [Acidobacteriota bacterium]